MRALGVSGASVGIENNKPDAITRLSRLASSYPGIRVVPLRVRYPQGAKTVDSGRYGSGGSAAAGITDRRGCRRLQCFDDGGRVRCGAEEQTSDRAGGDCYGSPGGGSEKSARPFRNAGGCLVGGCGRRAAGDVKVLNGGPMMGRAMSNLASPVVKAVRVLRCSGVRQPCVVGRAPVSNAPNACRLARWDWSLI